MIRMSINSKAFRKDMKNIIEYSFGYLDGIEKGKVAFFRNLGQNIKEFLEAYIDSNARSNPQALHHIYEWYKTGDSNSRLFNVSYVVNNLGLNFVTSFKQSTTIKDGSRTPFYNKAKIMEEGTPVTITPKTSDVLVFEVGTDQVFTKSSVNVDNPGGDFTVGSFEKIINSFFTKYFTQAFMRSSGVSKYLEKPKLYKKNLDAGKRSGKSKGIETGYRWIANAGIISND